ncbi:MAG: hypothetical protein QOF68_3017 [Gaiellales bacterium]|nr:hypothetical protein [Gaiellales bacterium]
MWVERCRQFMAELCAAAGTREVLSMTVDGVLLGAVRTRDSLTLKVYGRLPSDDRRKLLDKLAPIGLPTYDELCEHLNGVAELPADPGPAEVVGRRVA